MKEKVIALISEHTGIPKNDILSHTHLIADLGLNSYDMVELVCRFEGEFDIEIPDRAIRGLQRVEDIISYIESEA